MSAQPPSTPIKRYSLLSVFNPKPTGGGGGCGGGIVACLRHARTRASSAYPTRHSLRSFRVGFLKYRVSDTRRGVGQNMGMDIIQRDGWPLLISPRAIGTKPLITPHAQCGEADARNGRRVGDTQLLSVIFPIITCVFIYPFGNS